MTMQTDIRSARLTQTGWIVKGPTRVRAISARGGNGSTTGRVAMFDTPTVPITATYAQSGTTVTVTSTAHGLVTGQQIAIAYYPTSGGISATNGNCTVTVTGANTFTVPDINSNTVTAGTTCIYAVNGNYMFFMALAVGDIYANYLQLPAEGIKAYNNVYVTMDAGEIDSVYVYYG